MSKPSLISWNTTYRCNLKCAHCYASARAKQYPNELSTEEAKLMLDNLGRYKNLILVFSGGEPLVRSDILELVKYARENGIRPVMGTNGTLLRKKADDLLSHGVEKVGVSLDSHLPSVHDDFRGMNGSFERTIQGIKYAHQIGLHTQIHTTINQKNYQCISEMVQLAESLGSDAIHLFFMVPTGRAARISGWQPSVYEDILLNLFELQEASSILIKPVCAPHYMRVFSKSLETRERDTIEHFRRLGHFTRFRKGCLAGVSYARIDPFGKVTPCPYIPIEAGNIRQQQFTEIWESSKLFRDLRNPNYIKGKCGICDYGEICGRGCRARANEVANRLDAPEPWCSYIPQSS